MNYYEWSQEYYKTADDISVVIDRLKSSRKGASHSAKKDIEQKIAQYRIYYNECIQVANHLMDRHKGVA